MGRREATTRTATRPATRSVAQPSAPDAATTADPGFDRAILKIALELKKPNALAYDDIVEQTIRRMKLDPVAFRRYLGENGAKNMSLLLATARGSGL